MLAVHGSLPAYISNKSNQYNMHSVHPGICLKEESQMYRYCELCSSWSTGMFWVLFWIVVGVYQGVRYLLFISMHKIAAVFEKVVFRRALCVSDVGWENLTVCSLIPVGWAHQRASNVIWCWLLICCHPLTVCVSVCQVVAVENEDSVNWFCFAE